MAAASQTPLGRNPRRSPSLKKGLCGVCGFDVPAVTLALQRGVLVCRTHRGCWDNPNVYTGPRVRGPHYGEGGTTETADRGSADAPFDPAHAARSGQAGSSGTTETADRTLTNEVETDSPR